MTDTDGQCAAVRARLLGKLGQDVFRQILTHYRQSGFRQDNDVGGCFADLTVVFLNGGDDLFFIPFQTLFDIALHERDGTGAAVGFGKVGLLGDIADGTQHDYHAHRQQALFQTTRIVNQQHQPCADKCRRQRYQMNTAQRRKAGKRAFFDDLGIADCPPAKAGQQSFAGKFRQCPQNRQNDADLNPARQMKFLPQPKTGGGIQREKRRQQESQRNRV